MLVFNTIYVYLYVPSKKVVTCKATSSISTIANIIMTVNDLCKYVCKSTI